MSEYSITRSPAHPFTRSHAMRTLIIFARQPIPGETKTRLCPPLDGATAAALYACFLDDVLALARALPGVDPLIAYTPDSAGPFFAALAPDIPARPQRGAGLGERMDHAFRDSFHPTTYDVEDGGWRIEDRFSDASRVPFSIFHPPSSSAAVIIGSDIPDLPAAYVRDAFVRLESGADVVLGPAEDGGYYLIGLRAPQPGLLRGVPMSTPTVLADTLALAREQGLRADLLPPWSDIDTIADLQRLAARLRDAPPDVAPRTRAFLNAIAFLNES